ncbi:FAD-dependent monooxygenase [Inquilinus limosus]|uniref:FAD-dependent oxidoreductase n=1 Tax=Inquilinus limosus TaxID=171674 RepID=UPI003F150631
MADFDVIVAGAGISGVAAAAAMRDFGWRVLMVEPGQHLERRLAGELLHPRCVAGLAQLGLASEEILADSVAIGGFAVFPDMGGDEQAIRLPYGRHPSFPATAAALDQTRLRARLVEAARGFAHVEMMEGARVVAVDLADPGCARVVVRHKAGSSTLSCRLLIAADGSASPLRRLVGIAHRRRPISTLTGFELGSANLPMPGFGHMFLGGPSPVFAYEIGDGRSRVLLDHPIEQRSVPADAYRTALIAALPAPLGHELTKAARTQKSLSSVSCEVLVSGTVRHRVALVGDAGGTCHPLTATGMTVGVNDALALREVFCQAGGDVAAGLHLYARRRRGPQRARALLARALHDATSGTELAARTVRDGLVRYWTEDQRGREASMRILAMTDTRMLSIVREMLQVILYGLVQPDPIPASPLSRRLIRNAQLGWSILAMMTRHMAASMRAQ